MSCPDLPLFQRWPQLCQRIPTHPIGHWPSPVTQLRLGIGGAELWLKQDDQSGPLYGGNKVRKLEFILGSALSKGHTELWTVGAVGSHHCLATAIYAREAGLDTHLIHFPQPLTDHVKRNILAVASTGAHLHLVSRQSLPVAILRARIASLIAERRERPGFLFVPGGGSNDLGTLAFVNAALELAEQIRAAILPTPRRLFVAAGTCSTLAGLWLGLAIAGLPTQVIGVRVVDRFLTNTAAVKVLAARALRVLMTAGVKLPARKLLMRPVVLEHTQFGPGYGEPTREAIDALSALEQSDGIRLETTYTAKTLAAWMAAARSGNAEGPSLFWNTFNSQPLRLAEDAFERLPSAYQEMLGHDPRQT
ncbi:MAG: pyridoxal-phosphate dependent enzyme [Myxococcota bacterium]|jgi:D-cysteine desulfhydrase|nr:pyridoxal-phosphate dependent enzyme [Myxococcota bacterium]